MLLLLASVVFASMPAVNVFALNEETNECGYASVGAGFSLQEGFQHFYYRHNSTHITLNTSRGACYLTNFSSNQTNFTSYQVQMAEYCCSQLGLSYIGRVNKQPSFFHEFISLDNDMTYRTIADISPCPSFFLFFQAKITDFPHAIKRSACLDKLIASDCFINL